MNPGTRVTVPDDASGGCVFLRPGDEHEALEIKGPEGSSYMTEVGLVQYPDGCVKPWPFAKIRAA